VVVDSVATKGFGLTVSSTRWVADIPVDVWLLASRTYVPARTAASVVVAPDTAAEPTGPGPETTLHVVPAAGPTSVTTSILVVGSDIATCFRATMGAGAGVTATGAGDAAPVEPLPDPPHAASVRLATDVSNIERFIIMIGPFPFLVCCW
jgi:hypothetical protein